MKNIKQNLLLPGLMASAMLSADALSASSNSNAAPQLTESVGYYKKQLVKAEDSFYNLFNELTENKAYRVECKKKRVQDAMTRIKKRVCQAEFTKMVERGNLVQINAAFPELNATSLETKAQKYHHFNRLKAMQSDYIEQLVAKHQTLRVKFDEFKAAKKILWKAKNRS